MAVMEFLSQNILDTTTMLALNSNTATGAYLFDRNKKLGYVSSGYNSITATTIVVTFDETTAVSHVLLQNHNLKQFSLYYDTATASNLVQAFTTNSATSTYIPFSTISAANIKLVCTNTINGSEEKSIGELVIADRQLSFAQNPSYELFNPVIDRTQIRHRMPDGGTVLFNIKDKYKATIGLRYISSSFYSSLLSVYESAVPFYFVPFPTSTAWDGKAYEMVWADNFDFKFAENAKQNYSGDIILAETASG